MNPIIENMHKSIKIVQAFEQYMPESSIDICKIHRDTIVIQFGWLTFNFNTHDKTYYTDSKYVVLQDFKLPQEIVNIINML